MFSCSYPQSTRLCALSTNTSLSPDSYSLPSYLPTGPFSSVLWRAYSTETKFHHQFHSLPRTSLLSTSPCCTRVGLCAPLEYGKNDGISFPKLGCIQKTLQLPLESLSYTLPLLDHQLEGNQPPHHKEFCRGPRRPGFETSCQQPHECTWNQIL